MQAKAPSKGRRRSRSPRRSKRSAKGAHELSEEYLETLDYELNRELWFRGSLRHLCRPGPQLQAYDLIHARDPAFSAFSPFVFNFHRRLGKTFLALLLVIEVCLRAPWKRSKFAAPSLRQAQDILDEHWGIIMESCPPELHPKPFRNEKFTFRNPRWGGTGQKSVLSLYGVENDRGNKMRGGSTDACVLDECREFRDLQYTWGSVLLPTFRGRENPFALMDSTPPDSTDHPWVSKYIPEAEAIGRYLCVPGPQDPNWTQEEDDLFAREMGGRDTPEYRREILCELVSDTSQLIVPEFVRGEFRDEATREIIGNVHIEERERPEHYFALTYGDMGGAGQHKTDHTGILFGFLDFLENLVYFEDELFLRDLDTKSIAETWKKRATELYLVDEKDGPCHRLDWWADAVPQQLVDFSQLYDLHASSIPITNKEVARRQLRTAFSMGRVKIHPRCEQTIYQLRAGNRLPSGDFQRSKTLGHCDLVSAMIGAYRRADFEENPFPEKPYNPEETFVFPEAEPPESWGRYYQRNPRRRR